MHKEKNYLLFIIVFFGAILTGMKGAIYGAILIPLMINLRGIKGLTRQLGLWLLIALLTIYSLSLPAFETLATDFYFSWLGFFDLKRDELFSLLTSNRLSYYENTFSYILSKHFDPLMLLALAGLNEPALDLIEAVLSGRVGATRTALQLNPFLRSLHDDPRWQALMAEPGRGQER